MKHLIRKRIHSLAQVILMRTHTELRGSERVYRIHTHVVYCRRDCAERCLFYRHSLPPASLVDEAYSFFVMIFDGLAHTKGLPFETHTTIRRKCCMVCDKSTCLSSRMTSRSRSCIGTVVVMSPFDSCAMREIEILGVSAGAQRRTAVLETNFGHESDPGMFWRCQPTFPRPYHAL